MASEREEQAREIIDAMLDAIAEQAPSFKDDLRALVVERTGKTACTDTVKGRRKLPGTGNYARAFLDALDGFGMDHAADWYDNLPWDDTVLCDKMSVERFLGPLTEADDDGDDRVVVRFLSDRVPRDEGRRAALEHGDESAIDRQVLDDDIADIVDGAATPARPAKDA